MAMVLLMLARQHFVWWPFHPIGFPVSVAMHKMFVSVLVAWILKTLILKYGGPRMFIKLRPFFLGLVLGEFFPVGFLILLDALVG